MSKARQLADLLDSDGDVVVGALDNAPSSIADVSGQDNTATSFIDLPAGTTAERPSSPNTGYIRFNTTLELSEYYDGTQWKAIDSPPTITSLDTTEIDSNSGGTTNIVITGSNFQSGATVKAIGSDASQISASPVVLNSGSQITATFTDSQFSNSGEPYDIQVTNPSGLGATLDDQINVDSAPTWSTASGSLGTFYENTSVSVSATATDPDGDTIAYSKISGSLPSGLSLNSSTGQISGTAGSVSGDSTSTFSLRATANSKTSDRPFTILIREYGLVTNDPASNWTVSSSVSGRRSRTADRYFTSGSSKQVIVSSDHYSNSRAECWLTSNNVGRGQNTFWRGQGSGNFEDTMEIYFGSDEVTIKNLNVYSYPSGDYVLINAGLQYWNGSQFVTVAGVGSYSNASGWSWSQSNSPSTNTNTISFSGTIDEARAYKSTNWRVCYGLNVFNGGDDLIHQNGCGYLSYHNFG